MSEHVKVAVVYYSSRQAAAYQGARVVKIAAALKAGLHAS